MIKTITLEKEIKGIDEAQGIVEMYINAFRNEDSDQDISAKGSFKKTIKDNFKRIKHFLNHTGDLLLGLPLKFIEDDFGLLVTSQMNLAKQLVKDVFADYVLFANNDRTLEHSVRVQDIKRDTNNEKIVLEWKLWEYSTLYTWGSNEKTPLVNIKSMDDLELMIKDGNYSDEKSRQIESLYDKLKNLLKPGATQETEPETTLLTDNERMELFMKQLKF